MAQPRVTRVVEGILHKGKRELEQVVPGDLGQIGEGMLALERDGLVLFVLEVVVFIVEASLTQALDESPRKI